MNIKIWDNHNQQWLEPMAIFFGKNNTVWRVTACKIGEDPLSDGWYDLQGDDLKKIAIVGDFSWNVDLLPSVERSEQFYCTCSRAKGIDHDEEGTPYCISCQKEVQF